VEALVTFFINFLLERRDHKGTLVPLLKKLIYFFIFILILHHPPTFNLILFDFMEFINKLRLVGGIDNELKDILVFAHEQMHTKVPYLLCMLNPKLSVTNSWHNTISDAFNRAKLLGGDFKIYVNNITGKIQLTMDQCAIIQQCEEGELDPEKGCSIALAKELRAEREAENYLEQEMTEEMTEDEEEMMEIWMEKMTRPGRVAARDGIEYTKQQLREMILNNSE